MPLTKAIEAGLIQAPACCAPLHCLTELTSAHLKAAAAQLRGWKWKGQKCFVIMSIEIFVDNIVGSTEHPRVIDQSFCNDISKSEVRFMHSSPGQKWLRRLPQGAKNSLQLRLQLGLRKWVGGIKFAKQWLVLTLGAATFEHFPWPEHAA